MHNYFYSNFGKSKSKKSNENIPIADVEAGQMFASVLGVEDVLVNDEGRAASLTRIAAEKLTDYRNVS